jgi:hypothetical protein
MIAMMMESSRTEGQAENAQPTECPRVEEPPVHPATGAEKVRQRTPPRDILGIEVAAAMRGRARGLTKGIVALCDVLEIPLDDDRLASLDRLEVPRLEALLDTIRAERRWP